MVETRVAGDERIFSDLARKRVLRSEGEIGINGLVSKNIIGKKKGCDHTPSCFGSLLVPIHPIDFLVPNNLLEFSFL